MERYTLLVRPRHALAALFTSSALAACASARAPTSPSSATAASAAAMPAPGPIARATNVAALDADCIRCHAEAAATWRGSLHAQSFTDPVYQRSFALEPARFCHDCHAPEQTSAQHGIGCVTCHDPSGTGAVLAAPAGDAPRTDRTNAAHRVVRDARFAAEGACAGCHDFAFPDVEARGHDGARMQRTIDEHRVSRFSDRTCASCHMPKTTRGRSHAFTTATDVAMLRRALLVKAARRDGDRVELDLEPGDVGHSFPTGDLFRRLLVVAEVTAEDYRIVARDERTLGRHFRFEPSASAGGAKVQREIGDDRIDRPRRVALDLGEPAKGHTITWRIEYQRVESMRGDHATIADTIVVAKGLLEDPGGTNR